MIKIVSKKRALLPMAAMLAGIVLASTSQFASAQEYKKFTRVGTSQSICLGGVETAEQMQAYFAKNPDSINAILNDSGWSGSADALFAAVANGELIERTYPVGTRFAWAAAKVNGQNYAKPYREWAGSEPLDAFQVNVSSDCKVYHIAIPKACCNVSLVSVVDDESEACNPVPPVAVVEEPAPAPVAKPALALVPFFGLFAGSETRPRYEPSWDMDMVDSSGIAGFRAGLMKELSAKDSIFTQLSYFRRNSINEGNIYPDDNLAIDIGYDRKLGERAFIGAGIGAWNVDDSDYRDASIFGHVGGGIADTNLQWFLEGRLFDSSSANHDSLSDNKMFSAGVRYLIK